VSEQFALDQSFGDSPAVNGNEGPGTSGALGMNRSRRNFFAGTALASEQNGDVACGGTLHQRDGILYRR
jgi:hypothetical protein